MDRIQGWSRHSHPRDAQLHSVALSPLNSENTKFPMYARWNQFYVKFPSFWLISCPQYRVCTQFWFHCPVVYTVLQWSWYWTSTHTLPTDNVQPYVHQTVKACLVLLGHKLREVLLRLLFPRDISEIIPLLKKLVRYCIWCPKSNYPHTCPHSWALGRIVALFAVSKGHSPSSS